METCGIDMDESAASPSGSGPMLLVVSLIFVVLLNIIALIIANALGFGWADDAYISFRYAENLAEGHGLVFNHGQRVEGFSNPLWTLQLAAIAKLGGHLPDISVLLAVIAHVSCVILVSCTLAKRLCPDFGESAALTAGIFMAMSPPLIFYGGCALETAQHTLLFTGALTMTALSKRKTGAGLGVLCAALASISRPEGLGVSLVVIIVAAVRSDWSKRHRMTFIAAVLIATGAVFGSYLAWRHAYYDDWLPNTYYAKVDSLQPAILFRGMGAFAEFVLGSLILIWGPLWLLEIKAQPRSWAVVVVLGFGMMAAFTIRVGGDYMPLSRFLVPAWPILIAALVQCLCNVSSRLSSNPKAFLLISGMFVGAASGLAFYGGEYRNSLPKSDLDEYTMIGKWLARQARPGDSMAGTAMGAVPYVSKMQAHDFLGLTERSIAKQGKSIAGAPPGHRKQGAMQILEARPTFMVVWTRTFSYPMTEDEFIASRVNFPAFVDLLNAPDFAHAYRYAVVRVNSNIDPTPRYLALYVKRDRVLTDEVRPTQLRDLLK